MSEKGIQWQTSCCCEAIACCCQWTVSNMWVRTVSLQACAEVEQYIFSSISSSFLEHWEKLHCWFHKHLQRQELQFFTVSYIMMSWLNTRMLEVASVFSVDHSHINSTKAAVSGMAWSLPVNHGIFKLQTTIIAFGPPTQIFGAWPLYCLWRPSFILVTKFNDKISIVSMFYDTSNLVPPVYNGIFTADVVE